MFQYKEDKKKLRAKVKLTALFKNAPLQKQRTLKHRNTQNGSKSTSHKSQITNHYLLFPKRSAEMWRQLRRQFFRFWLTSQKSPKSKDVFDIAGRVLSETALNKVDTCIHTYARGAWNAKFHPGLHEWVDVGTYGRMYVRSILSEPIFLDA